jgi:serine/threonine protein phosphatase PrpC
MSNTAPINIALFASTDVGRVRQGNEDNFLVVNLSTADTWTADEDSAPPTDLLAFQQNYYGMVVAVSDGMGGALAGEVASNLAVHTVRDKMLEYQKDDPFKQLHFSERLRLAVEQANLLIHNESVQNPQYAGMGATFTGAGFVNDELYLAQIGDSRAYLIRNGQIQQMTRDQSLVASLVESQHITEEEAETHAYRNVILQALGATPSINVDLRRVKGQPRDVLLLCSDGLSGKVRAPEMLEIVTNAESLKDACSALIAKANERGGEDNITVVLIQIVGEGLKSPEDETSFNFDTVPRDSSLNEISRAIEDGSLADESDPTAETMQVDISEITLNESQSETEAATGTALATGSLPDATTDEHETGGFATRPLSPVTTENFHDATTQPMSIPDEFKNAESDLARTMELAPSPIDAPASLPPTVPLRAPAPTSSIPAKTGIATSALMIVVGLVLLLGGVFVVIWKFILHR